VEIDEQHVRLVRSGVDDVAVPHLLAQRLRHRSLASHYLRR
jgi:hypothetical protein